MKLCCIYNSAPHYRRSIFLKMDQELDCAFSFGDKPIGSKDIKSMDTKELTHFLGYLQNRIVIRAPWYWQKGAIGLLFRNFDTYIMLGEAYCVSTWIFLFLNRMFFKKKVYAWSHGWYGKETRLISLVKKIFFGLFDAVFLYGNYAKRIMIQNGGDPDKLHVIHNSLDHATQKTLRKTLSSTNIFKDYFSNEENVLIFVGRLTKIKALDLVIRSLAILAQQGKTYNFILIGDGEEKNALKKLVDELGVSPQVWFYGSCYDEEKLASLIYNADLCVSPGNVGLTAMHAMVFGCPVITHNKFSKQMPEFEAIREHATGLFFDYGNVDDLGKKIEEWFASHHDREKVRHSCQSEIDYHWTPEFQMSVIRNVLNVN